MKKIIGTFLVIVMFITNIQIPKVNAANLDYVELYGNFINHTDGTYTDLEYFLMNNYNECDVKYFKDCYMVDMNNDTIPELLCIFADKDSFGSNEYAVLVEYDNGFKLGDRIPFNYLDVRFGVEYTRILKGNGKFYIETYKMEGADWNSPVPVLTVSTENKIAINENGTEKIVYTSESNPQGCYVNGQQVEEIDYSYVYNNFEIVADGHDYEFITDHEPQYGADYTKFWDYEESISVTLDGEQVTFDQQPVIIDGRTLVPVRAVVEKMGGTVDWDQPTQTVTLTLGTDVIKLTVGSSTGYINGKAHALDVPPQIINERTLMPIRFIAEGFGYNVDWDQENLTVIITGTASGTDIQYKDVTNSMSQSLINEFAQFVEAEASTGEVAPYDLLGNYDCNGDNDIRQLMWHFMTDCAGQYLKTIPQFGFETHTEYFDNIRMRTQSYIMDTVIKEYYNISDEIPQFEAIGTYGPESLYYSNWYYFTVSTGRGNGTYETYVDKIYEIGDNIYYFEYRIASIDFETMEVFAVSDPYYAVMERKHLNNPSFTDLEFWSVRKTSTEPIYELSK